MDVQAQLAQFESTRDPRLLQAILPAFQPHEHQKEAVLLNQGEQWQHLFFVEKGLLRVHRLNAAGRSFNQHFYVEGTLLLPLTPEMESQPAPFCISALEPSVVWQVPAEQVRNVLQHHNLWSSVCNTLMGTLLARKLEREQALLTLNGTARYQRLCEQHPEWIQRVPALHLASYLGLTDVSLSRIRRALKASGG